MEWIVIVLINFTSIFVTELLKQDLDGVLPYVSTAVARNLRGCRFRVGCTRSQIPTIYENSSKCRMLLFGS